MNTFESILITLAAGGLYWLPTIVSAFRRLPHTGSVAVMNLFAFVVVPWWLALMMAVRSQPRPQYLYAPPPGFQPPPVQPPYQPQPQAGLDAPRGYQ